MKKSKSSKKTKKQCLDCNGRRWVLKPASSVGWILEPCTCVSVFYDETAIIAYHMIRNLISLLHDLGMDRVSIMRVLDFLDEIKN